MSRINGALFMLLNPVIMLSMCLVGTGLTVLIPAAGCATAILDKGLNCPGRSSFGQDLFCGAGATLWLCLTLERLLHGRTRSAVAFYAKLMVQGFAGCVLLLLVVYNNTGDVNYPTDLTVIVAGTAIMVMQMTVQVGINIIHDVITASQDKSSGSLPAKLPAY